MKTVDSVHLHIQQELYELVWQNTRRGDGLAPQRELSSIGKPPYPDINDFIRLQGLAADAMGNRCQYITAEYLAEQTGYAIDEMMDATNHIFAKISSKKDCMYCQVRRSEAGL